MTEMLKTLKLQPLKERRKQNRLILFYEGLNNKANIPIDDLKYPIRRTRHMHDKHINQIYASTDVFKQSFIPKTIRDWNQIDQNVLDLAASARDPITKFTELVRKD